MTLMACSWSLSAQTRTIHGTVLDAANNEPLIGATIMPVGGGQGAAADVDGNFTLTVPSNVHKATVSYVGYTSKTVDLVNGMKVYLSSSSTNLDDVVVVAYGTANKESLTGSVAVVGAKEIEDRPVTSVTAALEGNAPGVQVNNSTGTPGSAPSIRIRGFNSINGDNSPLYVVDGVPYEGSIADLNPADIESMSVLKDAASSALYGSKGANGVVLITTKKAKNVGKVDVTLSVRQGMYNRGLPFYDRLEQNEWMQAAFDAQVNGDVRYDQLYRGLDPATNYSKVLNNWRNNFISNYAHNNIYGVPDNELFDENGKFTQTAYLPGYTDLDWWDALSRNGHRQEYNVNAAAATEKFNIFSSAGYLKENGYTLNTDFERFTGRLNANFQPVSYFKMGLNLSAAAQESEVGSVDTSNLDAVNNPFLADSYAPIYPYYNHDAEGNIIYDKETGRPTWNVSDYNQGTNVAWEMRLNKNNYSQTTVDASLYGTAVIPYGFELTVRGNMYRSKRMSMEYNNNIVGSQRGSGMLSREADNYKTHTFMQTLTWSREYGANHVDVLLDHENWQYSFNGYYLQKANQSVPDRLDLNNFTDLMYNVEAGYTLRTESYLGRVRYNYDQKYFGEASIRRDGSSRFSKDNRWGTFWSVGASWVITKEKFMHGLTWLNYLKLRTAYGSVGNDVSAPEYAYMDLWSYRPFGDLMVLGPDSYGTPDLKWEATKTFDIGLEGSLFDDRFNFTIGYFNKVNSDLLFRMVLPNSVGVLGDGLNPSVWRNIGSMKNYGWELQFGVDIIRNKDWNWSFNIDATFLKNKITKLPDGRNLASQGLFIGKSIYEQTQNPYAGVDLLTGQSMYEIDPESFDFYQYDESGNWAPVPGLFESYVNLARNDSHAVFIEKDGKYYTSNTQYVGRVLKGTSLPTVYGSFGTNVSWKGINLGLLFTYSLGGKTYDSRYAGLMNVGSSAPGAIHKDILKSWTQAPEGMTADSPNRIDPDAIPQINSQFNGYNNAASSRWLTSSSYLTLKNINLSYDLPRRWVNAMMLQGINLGVSVDNVFIAAKRKGMNPTYGYAGGQGNTYVPARVFSFQLNVKF